MKKLKKDITGFTQASVGLGIGTAVVAGAGGSTYGLATMGSMMSPLATGIMGKHTLGLVDNLYVKKKKKKKIIW